MVKHSLSNLDLNQKIGLLCHLIHSIVAVEFRLQFTLDKRIPSKHIIIVA